jgi:hypothetical protein
MARPQRRPITPHRRYRCRFCGLLLPALPVTQAPNDALLLGHLSQSHRVESRVYVQRMRTTEDIARVAAEAYEVVEEDG